MGVTDETAVSHLFRRLTALEMQLGDTAHHLEQFIAASAEQDGSADPRAERSDGVPGARTAPAAAGHEEERDGFGGSRSERAGARHPTEAT